MANRPNLFIVGAPKCGTTSMARILSNHSQIYLPKIKETRYFVKEKLENLNYDYVCKSEKEYLEHFKEEGYSYYLDASPQYMFFEDTASKIKKFNSDSKIIIMIRNPTARAFSAYKHIIRDSMSNLTFEELLKREDEYREKELIYRLKSLGIYHKQIQPYYGVFSKLNVKVIVLEEFMKNQEGTLKEVMGWLNLEEEKINETKKFNKSGRPNYKLKFINFLKKFKIIKVIGKIFFTNEQYINFRNSNLDNLEIEVNTKKYLDEYFRGENIKLESDFNINISYWK